MPSYHLWTVGCQMNVADSERLGAALERLGYAQEPVAEKADIVVLNSCVVRQGAEDKVVARLDSLKGYKHGNPGVAIALMGCMVGPRTEALQRRFPHVDFFLRPQEFQSLVEFAAGRQGLACDTDLGLLVPSRPDIATFVPIIHGCDEFCTFCIVPYRRGRERSRPVAELVREAEMLVQRGVREITLLGQIVDRYGHDLPDKPDLADLLTALNEVAGLWRIRFLTSHPRDMSQRILEAVASLDKVCEHINVPFQAGSNAVLQRMRRPYTIEEYLALIDRIRATVPGVSVSTDVIVGFCGETEDDFEKTMNVVEQVRFDVVHTATYSTRPGTIAARKLTDDVPLREKLRRRTIVEMAQERIGGEINAKLLGERAEVIVERQSKGKWEGRTRTNKLVFLEDGSRDRQGQLVQVKIVQTSPWSLQGRLPGAETKIETPIERIQIIPLELVR